MQGTKNQTNAFALLCTALCNLSFGTTECKRSGRPFEVGASWRVGKVCTTLPEKFLLEIFFKKVMEHCFAEP